MLLFTTVYSEGYALYKIISPYRALYDPGRLRLDVGGPERIKQSLSIAELFVGDRLKSPRKAAEMKAGEADYAAVDGKKAAAFNDERGMLHTISSACTPMGCYVEWNDGERTWDCPCHGSRYTYDGKVIHSPTSMDLEEVKPQEKK